jgi:hypothetical protein
VGNRELLAVKMVLEEWKHWLEWAGHPFIVWTNHKNLEYLRTAKRLNSRQARWALLFTRFNFSLSYQPGSKNIKPALSRRYNPIVTTLEPETILPNSCLATALSWGIEKQVREAQRFQPNPLSRSPRWYLCLTLSALWFWSGPIPPGLPVTRVLVGPWSFGGLCLPVLTRVTQA